MTAQEPSRSIRATLAPVPAALEHDALKLTGILVTHHRAPPGFPGRQTRSTLSDARGNGMEIPDCAVHLSKLQGDLHIANDGVADNDESAVQERRCMPWHQHGLPAWPSSMALVRHLNLIAL
jgi:hypothetical protein